MALLEMLSRLHLKQIMTEGLMSHSSPMRSRTQLVQPIPKISTRSNWLFVKVIPTALVPTGGVGDVDGHRVRNYKAVDHENRHPSHIGEVIYMSFSIQTKKLC